MLNLKHISVNLWNWMSKQNAVWTFTVVQNLHCEWRSFIASPAISCNNFVSSLENTVSKAFTHWSIVTFSCSQKNKAHNSVPWFSCSILFVIGDELFSRNGFTAIRQSSSIWQVCTWSFAKCIWSTVPFQSPQWADSCKYFGEWLFLSKSGRVLKKTIG